MTNVFYKILGITILVALITSLNIYGVKKKYNAEIKRLKNNCEVLQKQKEDYVILDSINCSKIKDLKLTNKEFEQTIANNEKLIKELKQKKSKEIKKYSEVVTKTEYQIVTKIDTVKTKPSNKIVFYDKYLSINCKIDSGKIYGNISLIDSLILTKTIERKRFLGFLWKMNQIKNEEYNIAAKNPHTTINDFKVITIEK